MDTKKEMFLRTLRSAAKREESRLVMILHVFGSVEITTVSGRADMLKKADYIESKYDDFLCLTKGVSIVSYCVSE